MSATTNATAKQPKMRQSGVELLKIFGILLIVLSHTVQTLESNSNGLSNALDFYSPTLNPTLLTLAVLRYSGNLGNTLFFICSAWFLTSSKRTTFQKILRMIGDVWMISMLWLLTAWLAKTPLSTDRLLSSFFPIVRRSNWYITSYLVFCFVYPFLNFIIKHCNKKKHFYIALGCFFLYILPNFLFGFPYEYTWLLWSAIYLVISYFKFYCADFCNSKKANLILLLVSIFVGLTLIFVSNAVGFYFPDTKAQALMWSVRSNVFMLAFCFALLNLCGQMRFSSKFVNYISSLSLLVYVIHENIIFRQLYRPHIWQWIHDFLGYDCVLVWTVLFVFTLFILSCLIATAYKFTLQKIVYFVVDKLGVWLDKIYQKCERALRKRFFKPRNMRLQHSPFTAMENGTKTIEMRLFDEKRKTLSVGDFIRFTDIENGNVMLCEVVALHKYATFEQLYARFDKKALGYNDDDKANPADMLAYYKKEDVEKFGVLGIEVQKVK